MQKSVMRVRGSFGLKFADELKENGSARIDTDSNTRARVDVEDTLNNSGLFWVAPDALVITPAIKAVIKAETRLPKWACPLKIGVAFRVVTLAIYSIRPISVQPTEKEPTCHKRLLTREPASNRIRWAR